MKKALNVTMRPAEMICKDAPVFALKESRHSGIKDAIIWRRRVVAVSAFHDSLRDRIYLKASRIIRAAIAKVAPVKILVNEIAEVVVDVRLLMLELLEVNVDISDIRYH
ncbi:MAG: hypothetical protein ACXV5H_09470 [Halobacteriota archaeon]